MALTNLQKEKIAIEVIRTLVNRFEKFPEDTSGNRNAPFHEAFLSAFTDKLQGGVTNVPFFITLSSWLHGLNTTLGQQFFENIAHHLSNGEKREYTTKRLGSQYITQYQKESISELITDLNNTTQTPNLERENGVIFQNTDNTLVRALDFSADVFIEENNTITAIELKSVRPNSGEMRGEKQKILEGKAALCRLFPDKKIKFYIGFPFDPTENPATPTAYNKDRFFRSIVNMSKFFAQEETLLASELWDVLSGGNNTMEQILDIINAISTPEFLTKYDFLVKNNNRGLENYKKQLEEWCLFSEIFLIENDDQIKERIQDEIGWIRCYNQSLFNAQGIYNYNRYNILKDLIIQQ
jgi:type-2 restriction enzyme mjaII